MINQKYRITELSSSAIQRKIIAFSLLPAKPSFVRIMTVNHAQETI